MMLNEPPEKSAETNPNFGFLNEPQKEAVTYGDGPLLILAGAGTGKTRVITCRIAHLLERGVKPWNVLAVTFTNRAAAEMRERVHQLTKGAGAGVWVSTFHAFCAQFLRMEGPQYGLQRNFTIYDQDDQKQLIKECLSDLGVDEKKIKPGHLASKISREKDQLIDAASYAISASVSGDPNKELVASVYSLYQQKLKLAQALDFGDLIVKTVELLHENEPLRAKYQDRFHYLLVDEYQDTNRAQYVLTKMIAAKHKNICVVGDDDQAIYSWRGADIKNILDFENDYTGVKVVKLEENYRSTQHILSAAWNVVQNNRMRKEKQLWTSRKSDSAVEFEQLSSELEEARWVTGKIRELQEEKGYAPNQFSIFYRTNAQSRVLEDALRKAQMPYVLVGTVRFYERAEVKDVLAYLKLVVNPQDDLSFKRIINTPTRGLGKTTLSAMEAFAGSRSVSLYQSLSDPALLALFSPRTRESLTRFKAMIDGWIAERDTLQVSALVAKILGETRILSLLEEESKTDLEASARVDNVQELLNATKEFEQTTGQIAAADYLQQVALVTDADSMDGKKSGVTLMTVHIAKGLEFPVVFVTGLEEGLFPVGDSQFDLDELEEERRLAYVAMTRAKDLLFLTSAASRRIYGQTRWNQPSRFIREAGLSIETDLFDPEAGEGKQEYSFKETAQTSDDKGYRVGMRVKHAMFGTGKITEKSGSGDELKVVVRFDSGDWKKLLVKYAPLEKVR
jgi:DNA helicase-2/ATP-dependent DNA helicase PcrA